MYLKKLIELGREGKVSEVLWQDWVKKKFDPLTEAIRARRRSKFFISVAFLLIALGLIAFAAVILRSLDREVSFYILGGLWVSLAAMASGVWVLLKADFFLCNSMPAEFERLYSEATKILLAYGVNEDRMAKSTDSELRRWADEALIKQATIVKVCQEHDSLSESAESARSDFKRMHATFYKLGLVEERWDRFFR